MSKLLRSREGFEDSVVFRYTILGYSSFAIWHFERSNEGMPLVVAFEGLPGGGKTTVIRLLIQALCAACLRAVSVDIDTSAYASALRVATDALSLDNSVRSMHFWAMRIHQYRIVQEMQEHMDVIVMDRMWATALAFDGYGNGVPAAILDWIGQNLTPPDVTFLLQAPLKVLRARKKSRTMRDRAFAERVEKGYAQLARIHSWHCVDATRTPEDVKEQCLAIIYAALAKKRLP
ncbi:MAG: hypothetical protein A3B34_01445 [Candidatus Sungbacteria bacterium RIFCSPLOWO2_01_FULL_54_21]|uniref:Thymidylate kinase n=2 Tax=Candidatus Sungiibacteriota TaxID=1817917 RepID=A0A1G2L4E1_9BACT|nr:MAG: hypothetical protein A2679_02250 [Candidatus Sungbacteria bacterium RIFCSPHIGHO2_01_FULL_54_26]OHA06558.1 MAG: hypothetical protein A3B34_01445 [Candidatus Sungbacteria bacterium RIFCSPLOWO2_01_FULL_54_21]